MHISRHRFNHFNQVQSMDTQIVVSKKQWDEYLSEQIVSSSATYKINRSRFLGRGGFGIVYQGIRKRPKLNMNGHIYDYVAIKQFKKSQKWKEDNDKDKQLIILDRYRKELDPKYILEALDIFQHKHTQRYFLITRWCSGGNLTDRVRNFKSEKQIHQFLLRMAEILHYIHYEALADYRPIEKGENASERVGILHRDVKPANIVYQGDEKNTLFLLDFGVAKVAYTDKCMVYNNCGTNNYKAPQIQQNRPYNCKSDIYGLGCTLYEILSGGVKLIGSAGIVAKYAQRQKYVNKKLEQLNYRLILNNKQKENEKQKQKQNESIISNPVYWMQILNKCLAHDYKNRYSSKQLLHFVKSNDFHTNKADKTWYFGQLTNDQKTMRNKFQTFLLNFQIFRLSVIQDRIFGLFEFMYFEQPCIQKFTLYVIMKYITIYFNERTNKLKDQSRLLYKEKYNVIKKVIEDKKLGEIQKKATEKLNKLLEKEKESNRDNNTPIRDYLQRYPELLYQHTSEPRKILFQFCYQKRYELIEYEKMGNMLAVIMMMMDQWDYYQQLRIEVREFHNIDVEIMSIKRQHKLLMNVQKKIKDEGLRNIYDSCRVEGSPVSHLNKEENKSDIKIEKMYRT